MPGQSSYRIWRATMIIFFLWSGILGLVIGILLGAIVL